MIDPNKKRTPVHPDLGEPEIYRRIKDTRPKLDDREPEWREARPDPEPDPAPKIEKAKEILAEAEAKPINKGGRPSKFEGQKPWEVEGISKALWYRRKKDKSE
jgi:hypothetical protein